MIKEIKYLEHTVKALIKDPNEHIQKHWASGSFYEVQRNGLLNYMYIHYKGGVFWDIGASIGNHSLFFAKICGAKKVYAFEPSIESYRHYLELMELNEITNFEIFNIALGETSGTVGLKPPIGNNIGTIQVDTKGEGTTMKSIDTMSKLIETPTVVKIDVEHFNSPLLIGARETFTNLKCDIFIECESAEILGITENLMTMYGYRKVRRLVFNHTPTYLFKK